MAIGSTMEGQILSLLLAGKPITNFATTSGSTVVWCALHTSDPTSGTGQNQGEVSFTGYTRVSVDRSTAAAIGWTISGSGPATASPLGTITFPQLTSTSTGTVTYWSVGQSSATAGQIIASGTVTPNLNMGQNVTMQITTGSSITLS